MVKTTKNLGKSTGKKPSASGGKTASASRAVVIPAQSQVKNAITSVLSSLPGLPALSSGDAPGRAPLTKSEKEQLLRAGSLYAATTGLLLAYSLYHLFSGSLFIGCLVLLPSVAMGALSYLHLKAALT